MPKALAIVGMAVSVLLLAVFGLDLAAGFPFQQAAGWLTDVAFIICSGILGYMSWNTLREQI
jgi:ABC-type nickel/cobalt efflux system permease component RcnA